MEVRKIFSSISARAISDLFEDKIWADGAQVCP